MRPESVRQQLTAFIERLVLVSISVKQFYPSFRTLAGGAVSIGNRSGAGIALRDVAYDDVYKELNTNDLYDVKLVDGGLLIFQYEFDQSGFLHRHRLAYFPCPILPDVNEAPELYEQDELYGDIIARRLVRFPIRFDYSPSQHVDMLHPAAHLTLGQYANCRIPVSGPLGPSVFGLFILRNFYYRSYVRNKNIFDRRMPAVQRAITISANEQRIAHFVHSS